MNQTHNYFLDFEKFTLNFVIDLNDSIECTKLFPPPHIHDYAYAAGEIWLHSEGRSHLIIEKQPSENLLIVLDTIERELGSLRRTNSIEKIIPIGGWCNWTEGYWQRLREDKSTDADETTYDLLHPCFLLSGHFGCIAAYQHEETAVLEACTRPKKGKSIKVFSTFNPIEIQSQIKSMSSQLYDAIRKAST